MHSLSIEQLVQDVRDALESIPSNLWGESKEQFPRGWCTDASQVLGAILADHGYENFACFTGHRGDQSHSWLAGYGLIIDITAHQFKDAPQEVSIFIESPWHAYFINLESSEADYRKIPRSNFDFLNKLPEMHQYIINKIKN